MINLFQLIKIKVQVLDKAADTLATLVIDHIIVKSK